MCSDAISHLSAIAIQSGEEVVWDLKAYRILSQEPLNKMMSVKARPPVAASLRSPGKNPSQTGTTPDEGQFHLSLYYSLFPTSPFCCNLHIAFQTLFGPPALSSFSIHPIDIAVYFRRSAANSFFSACPFIRALSPSTSTSLFPKTSAMTRLSPTIFCVDMWD